MDSAQADTSIDHVTCRACRSRWDATRVRVTFRMVEFEAELGADQEGGSR